MVRRFTFLAALAVLAAASPAAAQQAAPADPPAPDEAPAGIEEVIVTATKTAENLQDVPVAVTAFTGETLRETGTVEVFDLQYQTPNLTITQSLASGSAAAIAMRGQSQADVLLTTDTSVGVYMDGVNMPRTLGVRGNMFDLERVEVVKGPQGTLYGRNTTGGAINLISKKPSYEALGGFVEAGVGNYKAWRLAGAINIPIWEQKLAMRVAGQLSRRDGFGESNFTGNDLANDHESFIRGTVQFDPMENLSVTLSGDWQEVEEQGGIIRPVAFSTNLGPAFGGTAGPNLFNAALATGVELGVINLANLAGTLPTGIPIAVAALNETLDNPFYKNSAGGQDFFPAHGKKADVNEFDSWGLGGTVKLDLGNVTVTSITGYREFDRHSTPDLDGTQFQLLHPNLNTDLQFWSEEVWLNGSLFDERLSWLVGGYYSDEEGTDGSRTFALRAINPANPSVLDGDVENKSWALFTQAQFEILEGLEAIAGVRYTEENKELVSRNQSGNGATPADPNDRVCTVPPPGTPISECEEEFDDTFDGWSYTFGLDYHVTEDLFTYVKYSQGFKGGGQNLRGGSNPDSFQDYDPEYANELEIGLKADLLDNRLRVNTAWFWTKYEDIQRSVIVPSTGANIVTVLTNAAEATIYGVELETVFEPIDGLTFNGTVGWLDPKYDDFVDLAAIQPPPPAPPVFVDRSDEEFGLPEWKLTLGARYELELGPGIAAASLNYTWQDEQIFESVNTDPTFPSSAVNIDAYSLLNMRLSYLLEGPEVEFAFFMNNLTDEKYVAGPLNLSTLGWYLNYSGDPRTYGFEIRKTFGAE